jgi:integrase
VLRLNEIQPKAVEDWLHTAFDSWWTRHGVRAIMTRVFNHAEGHGLWEEGKRSPSSRAKLGKKRPKRERRILSFEETARVLARLEEPNRLIIEICIATRARISEALGLIWRHVNLDAGTISIEQRVWHQHIGRPKSEDSKRILGIGDLVERLRIKAAEDCATPDSFVFQQKRAAASRSGIRVCAMLSIKQHRRNDAISPDWGHTRLGAPTLRGANRSAVAPLRLPRSPATATSK